MSLSKFVLIVVTLILFGFTVKPAKATQEPDFLIDQEMLYDCSNLEICNVNSAITLTNNNQDYFAKEFTLQTSLKNINSIQAFSEKTPLLTELEENAEQTIIKAKFPKAIVGKGSKISFNIQFKTKDILQNLGNATELFVPPIKNSDEISDAKIKIILPKKLGKPIKFTPFDNLYETENSIVVEYGKENSMGKNIYALFGNEQTYLYELTYYLENKNPILSGTYQIALIPDIENYQKSYISFISEKPISAKIDAEGNYLASYKLKPKEKKQVSIYGFVKVFIIQNPVINSKPPATGLSYLTKQQKYWEFNNPKIKKVFEKLYSADKAYVFLTENFSYSYKKAEEGSLTRMGILKSMENTNDLVCMDFTDLGVSILRSNKIPAREIIGFAYSNDIAKRPIVLIGEGNKDIYHSWIEYYQEGFGWKQMDPTWGNTSGIDYLTTMDLNHIALIRNPYVGYLKLSPYKINISVANSSDLKKAQSTAQALNFDKSTSEQQDFILYILLAPLLYMSFVVLKALLGARKK